MGADKFHQVQLGLLGAVLLGMSAYATQLRTEVIDLKKAANTKTEIAKQCRDTALRAFEQYERYNRDIQGELGCCSILEKEAHDNTQRRNAN